MNGNEQGTSKEVFAFVRLYEDMRPILEALSGEEVKALVLGVCGTYFDGAEMEIPADADKAFSIAARLCWSRAAADRKRDAQRNEALSRRSAAGSRAKGKQ